MSKKAITVLVMFVLFVAAIVSGKVHWNKKVAHATVQTAKAKTKKEEKQDAKASFNEAYAKNLPDAVKEKLKKAAEDKKAVNLVIVGDEASSSQKGAWATELTANLEASYGKGLWNVAVKEYKGESTDELIANKRDKEIAKDNPDVILFEPPFITDNGKTGNGNSVANTQKFVQALSTSAKGATIMIQPPNPVYGAKNYPKAVEALKQFATQNGYTYVDHWGAWPDATTKAILPYLQTEFGFPSAKGHEVWS
ncbi:SGNH/GDSL hydrolase family protein [Bacillus nitratireducens]|uniref:SGNH/GDSL hydrolase family protein n=1 Tax=Bacillus nitratireducens TaxID=2026193 RepID=UPI001BAD9906|nr:SGNH/GDSL hydrolase family protein [Bacillus nitratireducens]QUG86547.1 SGNH/GDSL hydrolase family protein [Bacillus nitratireducens]